MYGTSLVWFSSTIWTMQVVRLCQTSAGVRSTCHILYIYTVLLDLQLIAVKKPMVQNCCAVYGQHLNTKIDRITSSIKLNLWYIIWNKDYFQFNARVQMVVKTIYGWASIQEYTVFTVNWFVYTVHNIVFTVIGVCHDFSGYQRPTVVQTASF